MSNEKKILDDYLKELDEINRTSQENLRKIDRDHRIFSIIVWSIPIS